MSVARSPLRQLAPTRSRLVGTAGAAALTAGLGWLVGLPADRTAVVVGAVAVLALVARVAEPLESRWPDPPPSPTRPGWHGVASAQRLLEGAKRDDGDRRTLLARVDRLPVDDPRADEARRAAGARPTTSRSPR